MIVLSTIILTALSTTDRLTDRNRAMLEADQPPWWCSAFAVVGIFLLRSPVRP